MMPGDTTPLHDEHVAEGARMIEFAGYQMPVQYAGILAECKAVREAVGLFDVSHMGRFRIVGPGALTSVEAAVSSDVGLLESLRCQYALLLTPEGGITDDLFVYRPSERRDDYVLVVNAANALKDFALLQATLSDAELIDETRNTAMIAVQGPRAEALVAGLADFDVTALGLHHLARGRLAGVPVTASRTGYTGEDGFEVICPAEDAARLWRALRTAGGTSIGLGARDVLRLEAGYPLWGHEIDDDTRPADVGLTRVCATSRNYTGRSAHEAYAAQGPTKALVGITVDGRRPARDGAEVLLGEQPLGRVTSGTFSPTLGRGIALAHVANPERVPLAKRQRELAGLQVECVAGAVRLTGDLGPPRFYPRRG